MIANGSASTSRTAAMAEVTIPDSLLICAACNSAIAVGDAFCQECGAPLESAKAVESFANQTERTSNQEQSKFDYLSSAKRSAMLVGVIVAVVLSVGAVMAIAGSYDAMSEDYICDHAKKLLRENDSVQAAEILQRLYFARGIKLKTGTQELLGQALVKRSELYSSRNQIELATKDLKDVPPNTTQSSIAAERLSKLALPSVPIANIVEPPKISSPQPAVAKAKAVPSEVLATVAKAPVLANKTITAADDVTSYNRLLTAFFEKTGAEGEPSTDASAEESTKVAEEVNPVREPPTLKEWVEAGRRDF